VWAGEVLEDPGWAGARGSVEVDLPDAAEMAEYDTLELDLRLGCRGEGEYGDCPAWDYIVHLYLCDEAEPSTCNVEIGRWITTYHREGRWVHDVSPLLPLVASGGRRRLELYTQQPYEVTLTLRLSSQGREVRPVEVVPLFEGGSFDATSNDRYAPLTVDVPADATRVEVATVISGHGMSSPGNCAEFCDTTHHFLVNGADNVVSFPQAGTESDCMARVDRGTVPNQYGTWWYGRSGWCPGLEVPLATVDVTDQVVVGGPNTFEYHGLYGGEPYPGGGAAIHMRSWLVISR
jgi:hypothetical protein